MDNFLHGNPTTLPYEKPRFSTRIAFQVLDGGSPSLSRFSFLARTPLSPLCICRAVHSRCAVRARRVQGYRSHLTFTHRQDRAIGFLSGGQQSVRGPARVSCGEPSVATDGQVAGDSSS